VPILVKKIDQEMRPRTRTKLGERALSVCGPVACNVLPATRPIRNTTDSKLFKRRLKSHFYNRSFDITA